MNTLPALPDPRSPKKNGITGKVWWPWLKRIAALVFFALVAWLLVKEGRAIEWHEVFATLRAYPPALLLGAVALAALSLGLYSCFDLLGRHYTGHTLRAPTVLLVTFISYVFNLNLGSLVGGVAFRYRLYSRLKLDVGTITRILSLSMLTNWTGYLFLGGLIFAFATPALPRGWTLGSAGLQVLGYVLLATAVAYLLLCALSRQRSITLHGYRLELPSGRMALLQVTMGATNWLLMSSLVFVLLQQKIAFPAVAGVLLVAAVAGVIAHVPAGLGVLEAVFVALLSRAMPAHQLLAALVAYRVIYYLVPLALATAIYLVMEVRAKKTAPAATPAEAATAEASS
ncbi:lysylphosphatidylglycerol synthase domain-containing protein [Polaromonas sp.]|uniref:lysylphosphatidylglycerol synthase domain-containing protein n=1 Tax=Polaromonas sp. TaxID=1869339 RepID=UPI002732FF53|nr:lysylphosphatidylglycerol synthase domain-containing protein [Polaromonas sp.]MDP3756070.1 lysylphosphatidylglycerol synthase domain-containing protein [Polaromonas sp.]